MPPLDDLLGSLEFPDCPAPPDPRPPFGVDLLLGVPGDPLTPLEQLWQPGDRIELQVREGIIDAVGGGTCAIWRGRTLRPGDPSSEWTPTQTSAPDCLPVPEPSLTAALIVGVLWLGLSFVVCSRIGRRLRRLGESYPVVSTECTPPDSEDRAGGGSTSR